jgi:tetratricopeptide (TPR) repeat protein
MFAEAAAQAGDFDLSLRELHGTTDPMRRAQAVQGIVQGYLSDGVEDTTAALALASTISSVDDRVGMLASIASAQARRGDIAAAKRTVEECLKSLDQTSDSLRFWDTISLASTKYELGDRARAAELFDAAVKFAGRYKNHFESYEFYSLAVLVAERASLGDEQGALSTARGANDNALFGDIAEAEAEKGQADAALKWVEKLQDPFAKGNALMSLVRGILEKQDSDEEPKNAEYPRCK